MRTWRENRNRPAKLASSTKREEALNDENRKFAKKIKEAEGERNHAELRKKSDLEQERDKLALELVDEQRAHRKCQEELEALEVEVISVISVISSPDKFPPRRWRSR